MPGQFIVFEGIDTGVLSEEAEKLADWLKEEGHSVVTTREPTDGPLGAQLRLFLNGRFSMHEYARALLFVADRMDHYFGTGTTEENTIQKDTRDGKFVLSVRYLLYDYAQQSETLPLDWLMKINHFFPWPGLMIFIDMPVDSVLTKVIKERGYDETEVKNKREELMMLRNGYLKTIATLKEQGLQINVIESDSMEVIHRHSIKLVHNTFMESNA
jgi:dTMP kinase